MGHYGGKVAQAGAGGEQEKRSRGLGGPVTKRATWAGEPEAMGFVLSKIFWAIAAPGNLLLLMLAVGTVRPGGAGPPRRSPPGARAGGRRPARRRVPHVPVAAYPPRACLPHT